MATVRPQHINLELDVINQPFFDMIVPILNQDCLGARLWRKECFVQFNAISLVIKYHGCYELKLCSKCANHIRVFNEELYRQHMDLFGKRLMSFRDRLEATKREFGVK